MAMQAKLWTVNGLATELGRDRRTIAKALDGVPPDGAVGKGRGWYLTTAIRALEAHGGAPRGEARVLEAGSRPIGAFAVLLMERLADWREIANQGDPRLFSVEEAAKLLGAEAGTVLTWLRLGMPYAVKGDWETGEGFQLRLSWVIDWSTHTMALLVHLGKTAAAERLGLGMR